LLVVVEVVVVATVCILEALEHPGKVMQVELNQDIIVLAAGVVQEDRDLALVIL
jgi:hypothetical protein